MVALPHWRVSTADYAPSRRFAAYRDREFLFDVSAHRHDRAAFQMRLDAYQLGEAALVCTKGVPMKWERATPKCARDGIEHYLIDTCTRGTNHVLSGEGGAVSAGALMLNDTAQPYRAQTTDFEMTSLLVPRALLAPRLAEPDGPSARLMKTTNPLVALARDSLLALRRSVPTLQTHQGAAALGPVLDMMAAAVNDDVATNPTSRRAVQWGLRARIRRHVNARLLEQDLSPRSIQNALGVSKTHLYRCFPQAGGIARYIRDRRLDRALRALRDPRNRHQGLSAIAMDHGFASQTVFGRCFKARFGFTPTDARATTCEAPRSPETDEHTRGEWDFGAWAKHA